jgi:hypothetical protein
MICFFQRDAFELDSYMAESFGRFLDKKAAQASTDGLNQPEELTRIREWVNAITSNPEEAHGLPIPPGRGCGSGLSADAAGFG